MNDLTIRSIKPDREEIGELGVSNINIPGLLIVGGQPYSLSGQSVELYDLRSGSSQCELKDLPNKRDSHTLNTLENKKIVCGGFFSSFYDHFNRNTDK